MGAFGLTPANRGVQEIAMGVRPVLRGSRPERIVKKAAELDEILVDLRETRIDGGEPRVDGNESRVNGGEPRVNRGEALVHVRPEVIDPLSQLINLPTPVEESAGNRHQNWHYNRDGLNPSHVINNTTRLRICLVLYIVRCSRIPNPVWARPEGLRRKGGARRGAPAHRSIP